MKEMVLCEKCGTVMVPMDSSKPIGMECPNCGWGWATTYIDPIYEDENKYVVSLAEGNTSTTRAIQTISRITGNNYLVSKKMLDSSSSPIVEGRAVEVKPVIEQLHKAGIRYTINPDFNYHID